MYGRYATQRLAPAPGTRFGFRRRISLCLLGAPRPQPQVLHLPSRAPLPIWRLAGEPVPPLIAVGIVDSRVNQARVGSDHGVPDGHRARRAPPREVHRAGRFGARPHLSQPARGRGGGQGRAPHRRGPSRRRRASRTPNAWRWRSARRIPPAPRSTSRWSRAPTTAAPRRARMRSSRPASPAWWWPPTTRSPKVAGRGLGILRDEGVEVVVVDGDDRRARAPDQPALSQARAHRAVRW